jgi:hypothetical protein
MDSTTDCPRTHEKEQLPSLILLTRRVERAQGVKPFNQKQILLRMGESHRTFQAS